MVGETVLVNLGQWLPSLTGMGAVVGFLWYFVVQINKRIDDSRKHNDAKHDSTTELLKVYIGSVENLIKVTSDATNKRTDDIREELHHFTDPNRK